MGSLPSNKAIDLIDEAASRLKMEVESLPQPLDRLRRQMSALKVEAGGSESGDGHSAKARAREMQTEIANLEEEDRSMTAQWQQEKKTIEAIQS